MNHLNLEDMLEAAGKVESWEQGHIPDGACYNAKYKIGRKLTATVKVMEIEKRNNFSKHKGSAVYRISAEVDGVTIGIEEGPQLEGTFKEVSRKYSERITDEKATNERLIDGIKKEAIGSIKGEKTLEFTAEDAAMFGLGLKKWESYSSYMPSAKYFVRKKCRDGELRIDVERNYNVYSVQITAEYSAEVSFSMKDNKVVLAQFSGEDAKKVFDAGERKFRENLSEKTRPILKPGEIVLNYVNIARIAKSISKWDESNESFKGVFRFKDIRHITKKRALVIHITSKHNNYYAGVEFIPDKEYSLINPVMYLSFEESQSLGRLVAERVEISKHVEECKKEQLAPQLADKFKRAIGRGNERLPLSRRLGL